MGTVGTGLAYLIRPVEQDDASDVCVLERECFPDPYPKYLIDDLMKTERDRFFVAVHSGRIVGYTVATIAGRAAHLVSLAVHPLLRGQGIGTSLLSAVTKELTLSKVAQVYLEVRKGNLDAILFYKRMGFEETSQIRHYYGDGEDALAMSKSVTVS